MRISRVIAVTAILALISGCSSQSAPINTISVNDVSSSRVNLNETPQFKRVVALANGSAEIIDALGLKSILVGRDIASTDPSLESVPIVTSGHQVIAEKIISLNPDLVIIDASVGPSEALASLKAAHIPLRSINEVWSVSDISSKVAAVAAIIGAPRSGAALVEKMAGSFHLTSTSSHPVRIAFLYLRGGNSIYLLGGKGSGADSIIHSIGARDIGSEISATPFTALTAESFAQENPQLLLVMTKGLESVGGVEGLVALPGIAQTEAGKSKRVISVDDSLLLSFGPRTPSLLGALQRHVKEVMR